MPAAEARADARAPEAGQADADARAERWLSELLALGEQAGWADAPRPSEPADGEAA